ncbi:DUF368 domain-containing protein [Zooshikella harenae]|uniref:DUF368 domain-containing protein n=1 Tax=Zooshikella harenae TaxID=2827238 RepID=A0ABS5Z6U7_9GAMM|nr:DUF368 domain-containing protein [Zooshikella harenae]MBU2709775.1 DUF368 domain-containing protein [Zooshikella harenae]
MLLLFLKGMAMGAADIVPGVSGGTIAFITGIYDQLIESVRRVNHQALRHLFNDGWKAAWEYINGPFIVTLFLGILVSIFSLSQVISYLLLNYPVHLWSFFFGLIIVSAFFIIRQIERWKFSSFMSAICGTVFAFWITVATPITMSADYFHLFLGGAIAVCAMILPGVSGSFILLLLGLYAPVIDAIKSFNMLTIATIGLGCVTGLLLFSNILAWLLKNVRDITFAFLTGLMMGSLNKVWPWKVTESVRLNSEGHEVPFLQKNVSPFDYEMITGESSSLVLAIILMITAIILVISLDCLRRPIHD